MKTVVMFKESAGPLRVDAVPEKHKSAKDSGYLELEGFGKRLSSHLERGVAAVLVVTSFECTEEVEDLVVEAYSVQEDQMHRDVVFGSMLIDTYGWPKFLREQKQDFIDRLAYRLSFCDVGVYVD
jgi:hypothetical protein